MSFCYHQALKGQDYCGEFFSRKVYYAYYAWKTKNSVNIQVDQSSFSVWLV